MSDKNMSELQCVFEKDGITITDTQIRTETETLLLADIRGVQIVEDKELVGRWVWYVVIAVVAVFLSVAGDAWIGMAIGLAGCYLGIPMIIGGFNVFVTTQTGRNKLVHFGFFDLSADRCCKSFQEANEHAKAVSDAISDAIARKQTPQNCDGAQNTH